MGVPVIRRRALLALGGGATFASFLPERASAMDRVPSGGVLRMTLPLGLRAFDPHDARSLDAAVFGASLFDPLFAQDDAGRPYAALAERLPEPVAGGLRVTLRAGLRTALDLPLDSNDLLFSLKRARAGAASSWLAPFGVPRTLRGDSRSVLFPAGDAAALALALASPAAAIVPRSFSPSLPDGTGAFRAAPTRDGLVLERNPRAARGPAFLERIELRRAPGLADSLRAFEAGDADVGWLATGLHHARKRAVRFDAGPIGHVVLMTGQKLGAWGAPGVAQTVLDGVDRSGLAALGVHVAAGRTAAPTPWRGPASDVLVDGDCPQLVAITRSLVEMLGGSARGLRVVPVAPAELGRALTANEFSLCVDFVRRIGSAPGDDARALLARAGGASSKLAVDEPLSSLTRRLRLGWVGALHIEGALTERHVGLARWQLGDVYVRGT